MIYVIALIVVVAIIACVQTINERQLAQDRLRATERWQARRGALAARFGPNIADAIMAGRIWQGATWEMVVEALGRPADVDERVLKTKTTHVYKYKPLGANRYGLRVTLENGVVVGWEEKG